MTVKWIWETVSVKPVRGLRVPPPGSLPFPPDPPVCMNLTITPTRDRPILCFLLSTGRVVRGSVRGINRVRTLDLHTPLLTIVGDREVSYLHAYHDSFRVTGGPFQDLGCKMDFVFVLYGLFFKSTREGEKKWIQKLKERPFVFKTLLLKVGRNRFSILLPITGKFWGLN